MGSDEDMDITDGNNENDKIEDQDESFDEEGFGAEEEDDQILKQKNQKLSKKKIPKFDPNDLSTLLVDAEEFSHLLDENDDEAMTSSVSTKDKASKKQIL